MSVDRPHWTVDRKVPLALIVTIAMQTIGFSYFMGNLSTRLTMVESVMASRGMVDSRLTRVEVQLENIVESIKRIEKSVSQ